MKVYKFFKIPDQDDDKDLDVERKYVLYAITNNKEYAERFKANRNMDKFIYKVHKGVTKQEYADMCNEERNSVLLTYSVSTVKENKHTRKNVVDKEVLITYWEKQLIEEPNLLIDNEEFWQQMPCPFIFKDKYVKSLKALEYITFYKLMSLGFNSDYLIEKMNEHTDDYSAPAIAYDELNVLIHTIIDTL